MPPRAELKQIGRDCSLAWHNRRS